MAQTTVIDQLIVKLGLDPRDFTKGEKQIAAGVLRTKENVRKGASDMSKSFEGAGRSMAAQGGVIAKVFGKGGALGLAIAATIGALKLINDKFYEVAENTRKLGLDARNFNTTAAGLRNMQNAAELAGGSLEDATTAASGLGKALFDVKFNGQISEQLIMLGRLGVQWTDATGKARDFKDVALDTADALAKAQASGQMSRAEAFQFAQQAGFGGGMANLVADGPAALRDALAKQEARRQVSGEDVRAADERVRAYDSLGQAALAEVGVPGMAAESPMMTALSKKSESALTGGVHALGSAIDSASMALGDLADSAKEVSGSFGRAVTAQGVWMRGKIYEPAIDKAADKYGIDRDVLRGIARVESGNDPNAVNPKSGAAGLMQLNPKFFPNAGKNPYSDIDTAAKHFRSLLDSFEAEGGSTTPQEQYIHALRAYNAGETNYRTGRNLGRENRAYAGKVLAGTSMALPTPGAQGAATTNNTDITFESVTINTPRTDGQGVAAEFVEATRRKMMAAQADTGMQ